MRVGLCNETDGRNLSQLTCTIITDNTRYRPTRKQTRSQFTRLTVLISTYSYIPTKQCTRTFTLNLKKKKIKVNFQNLSLLSKNRVTDNFLRTQTHQASTLHGELQPSESIGHPGCEVAGRSTQILVSPGL